jgi:hypothetical protein
MLFGHAGESVTEQHYMGRSLPTMARAIASLALTLPERPGVEPRSEESSSESSRAPEPDSDTMLEASAVASASQLHPIELPQLRHL